MFNISGILLEAGDRCGAEAASAVASSSRVEHEPLTPRRGDFALELKEFRSGATVVTGWTPAHCQECHRANRADARRCMWCGAAVNSADGSTTSIMGSVEVEYVSGLERLDNPSPVRIAVDGGGVIISELIPGTRSARILNENIIGARAFARAQAAEARPRYTPRWWRGLHSFASDDQGEPAIDDKRRGHTLSIRYRDGEEVRTAVFRREDLAGLSMINGLARLISSLAAKRSAH